MSVKKVIKPNPENPASPRESKGKRQLVPTLSQSLRGRLPRGSSSLPREVVELEQRKRIVLGAARAVAEKGYAEASVAQIIAQAGVSRATFYTLFSDKEECFLYGFAKLSKAHLDEVEREINGRGPLPERLINAISAYLRRINIDQPLARAFITEAQGATPGLREAYEQVQRRLQRGLQTWIDQVRQENPGVPDPTDIDISLVMNGLNGHVIAQVRAGVAFSDAHIVAICRYIFAALGLYEWARYLKQADLLPSQKLARS